MRHKPHILLVGMDQQITDPKFQHISFHKCTSAQEALEIFIETDLLLLVCPFQMSDLTAPGLYHNLKSFLALYPDSKKQDTKLLVITHTAEEEKQCKDLKIMYYPYDMDFSDLLNKIINTSDFQPQKEQLLPINLDELFLRVDNNRAFIKTVIEKFFATYRERTEEICKLISQDAHQQTKDSAHKLKGVLANFSMEKARKTIIEIEKCALDKNTEKTLRLVEILNKQIEEAKDYYKKHKDLFTDK